MRPIALIPVRQFGRTFYAGKLDPRLLIRLTDDIQVGDIQDAQRPLEEKHLREISAYVGEEHGMLPGSVMLSTKRNEAGRLLKVQSEQVEVLLEDGSRRREERYFLEIPDREAEFEAYQGTLDVIDGQHRIFAFREDFRSPDVKDDIPYEITFSLFEVPTVRERQMLFMVTNEKQKAVSGNLLLWLRQKLGLLSERERKYYPTITELNTEHCSPLKGRIIMSAERIPKGYKAKELVKILAKTFPENMLVDASPATEEQKFDALCRYLRGWEAFYGLSFQEPGKDTMTKISGLRYILWLFPLFWKHAIEEQRPLNDEFVGEMIQALQESTGQETLFENSADFRGEGATDKAVKDHSSCCETFLTLRRRRTFNPLA